MNILVVEDERQLAQTLQALLKQQQYIVDIVFDGAAGEEYALSGIYDAIILDIMLPQKNGLDVLRSLREQGLETPILLLSAKSEVEDKISGLSRGADDYLTKPFDAGELLARIQSITRRKGALTGDVLEFERTQLSRASHSISHGKAQVKLGAKEYLVLELLMQNAQQIIPKERFIEKIWGFESNAEYNAIEVYVSFLRKKLAAIGSPVQIKAVRKVGYTLEAEHD